MLTALTDSILALVFPQECGECGREVERSADGIACSRCWNETRIFDGNETLCKKCGAFLFDHGRSAAIVCQKCDEHCYDFALAGGVYEKALAASIIRLKKTPHISKRVRELLRSTLRRMPIADGETVAVPIPLSPRRQRERGFNQAAILARALSTRFTIDESSLIRSIHTPLHRAGMDRKARARTVKNAFEVTRPKLVENKNILLVDDVLTSGATASSCASVLKESGALTVNVLTIARAA